MVHRATFGQVQRGEGCCSKALLARTEEHCPHAQNIEWLIVEHDVGFLPPLTGITAYIVAGATDLKVDRHILKVCCAHLAD